MEYEEAKRLMNEAIDTNRKDEVTTIISRYGLSYVPEWRGGYALIIRTLLRKKEEAVQALIVQNADINGPSHANSIVPLCRILKYSTTELAWLLIARGANINADNDDSGNRPIHQLVIAVEQETGENRAGLTEIMEYMLHNEVEVEARNREGVAAVHLDVRQGYMEIFDLFTEHNGNMDIEDDKGRTPLFYAAEYRQSEKVNALSKQGARVNHRDCHGMTPLFMIFKKILARRYKGNNLYSPNHIRKMEITEMLIKFGANFNQQTTNEGATPLHLAGAKGYDEIVTMLLENGANVNLKDKKGRYAVQYCRYGRQNDDLPAGYEKEPDEISSATEGHVSWTHSIVRQFLIRKRVMGDMINQDLELELLYLKQNEAEYEVKCKKEMEEMKEMVLIRQEEREVTPINVWKASTESMKRFIRHKDFFRKLQREKIGRYGNDMLEKVAAARYREKLIKRAIRVLNNVTRNSKMPLGKFPKYVLDEIVSNINNEELIRMTRMEQ
ncbi:ankyrin-2-like [Microplitis demolitor]|uniref:ankyrin-2-like n=1 Tax=Microplitis demolitor TaxID=69319 RepID=UPI00235B6E66|nr:ankyrin-2-like [Microplitis demolitor]